MRARLKEFSLSLHPDKTRLIEFGRFAATNRKRRGLSKPETFNFLGFTFISGKSRRGHFLIKRKTRRDRMQAKLQEIKKELRERMHQPIPKQGQWLKQIVTGYFHYHAVPTNSRALARFRHHIAHLWLRVLRRRSQRDGITWERIEKLVDEWLPKAHILHPWPSERFAVNHPRYARAAHSDRTDAGHDFALWQMPVAHQPPAAIIGELVGMPAEQARNLGLDGLRQKRSRAAAQNLGQRVGKSPWLRESENISVGHGVSLLCWRSGGVEHPHDTPPYPFTPSPTFAHSSRLSQPEDLSGTS